MYGWASDVPERQELTVGTITTTTITWNWRTFQNLLWVFIGPNLRGVIVNKILRARDCLATPPSFDPVSGLFWGIWRQIMDTSEESEVPSVVNLNALLLSK